MTAPPGRADGWTILYKSALLGCAALSMLLSGAASILGVVFFLLLYICANMTYYLMEPAPLRFAAAAAAIGIAVVAAAQVQPLWLLLLPAHLVEAASLRAGYATRTAAAAAALIAVSALFVPGGWLAPYLLVGAMTWVSYGAVRSLQSKLRDALADRDRQREASEQLRAQLKDSDAVLRQTEYTTKLEERNRMSQNVHDTIGHAMAGALIQMEAAKRLVRADPDKSAELLDNAIRISKEGIDRIRADLTALKPATEQLGIHRLKLLLEEFSARHPIRTALVYEGDLNAISPIHWKIIQENVKEALTNTLKYAGATGVSVRIQVLPTLIRAEAADNGRGEAKFIKGIGILGMEERAAAVNGQVIADGSGGFSVTTLLPYPL